MSLLRPQTQPPSMPPVPVPAMPGPMPASLQLPSTASPVPSLLPLPAPIAMAPVGMAPIGMAFPLKTEGKEGKEAVEARVRNTMGRIAWRAEEDAMILEEVERHGQKWRIVAAALPGRSDDSVRNRWNRLVKDKPRVAGVAGAAGAAARVAVSTTADEPADGGELSAESARGTKQAGKPKAKVKDRLAWSREEDDLIAPFTEIISA